MSTRLRTPLEWREQEALITWAALHTAQEPRLKLMYAIPNGEKRDKSTAAKLMKMGVRPHVPDLHLPVAARHYYDDPDGSERWWSFHGLWIEMKRVDAYGATIDQQAYHELLRYHGHYVATCHGWVAAVQKLCWYLKREELAYGLQA